jgi:hypothetical protein
VKCGHRCLALCGLFWANFAHSRLHWKPCRSAWHGACYQPHPLDHFYYHVATDDDGFDWRPPEALQRFRVARDGDHLLTSFQCDLCCFRNLQRRDPFPGLPQDDLLLCGIRQANLDALWGREPHTVADTLRGVRHLVRLWGKLGLAPCLPPLGPYPVSDLLGMSVALAMLMKTLEPGRYNVQYQQFETVRKLRVAFSNVYMALMEGVTSLRTVGGDRAKHHLTYSPTQSLWFERFAQGCVRRMGQDVRQDWAIPLGAMLGLYQVLEEEWSALGEADLVRESCLASIGAYSIIAFCGSFWGSEVFLTDLHGLRKHLEATQTQGRDHVVIPLLGRFKGEQNSRYHLAPLAATTSSGLRVQTWVERLVNVREKEGRRQGPAFCDDRGGIARAHVYEGWIMERLLRVQATIPGAISTEVDIYEQFGISRSFRRDATSAARTRKVDDRVVDLINRWCRFEGARGKHPTLPMREHYSDMAIMIPELIKFSKAL